jgi:hypothetical protein
MFWHEYWMTILLGILALPLISVGVSALWMSRQPNMNVENGAKCWDVFVKLISALTVVVSGAMLFGKYIDQQGELQAQRAAQQQKELNLRKAEFLRQKLLFDTERHQRKRLLFDEAKSLAARIASSESRDHDLLKRFDELYFAALIGVEKLKGPVEGAMVQFRKKLTEDGHDRSEVESSESLPQLALKLSSACETELTESEKLLLQQHAAIADLITAASGK